MALRPILELPHPILRKRAKKVRRVDSSILRLAYDMVDTMKEARGVGLAANQVGELWRVIVIDMPEEDEARIYINPEIVHHEGEREIEEGCLSIPGYRGLVTRSVLIKFGAIDHTSKVVKFKAEDLLAQALEHEVDHLNGILYIDHLTDHENSFWEIEPESEAEDKGIETRESGLIVPKGAEASENDSPLVPDATQLDSPASLKLK